MHVKKRGLILRLTITLSLLCSIVSVIANFSVDTLDIYSTTLKENRQILIFRPENLQNTDSVVVLYLPDGESANYYYSTIVKEQSGKHIIAVGILQTDRRRDLLPINEADKFLEFIASELVPQIEKNLMVRERILYGHSFGGGFTVYSLISKPGLFDKYIASSPTPIMNMVDPVLYQKAGTSVSKPILFYFSYGSEDMKLVIKWAEKLKENLMTLNCNYIHWKIEIHGGENHATNDIPSLISGLRFQCD
jgi:predicted esterase